MRCFLLCNSINFLNYVVIIHLIFFNKTIYIKFYVQNRVTHELLPSTRSIAYSQVKLMSVCILQQKKVFVFFFQNILRGIKLNLHQI